MSKMALPITRKSRRALKVWAAFLTVLAVLCTLVVLVERGRRREYAGWADTVEKRRNLKWSIQEISRPTFEQICRRYTPNGTPTTYVDDSRALFRSFFDGRTFGSE